MLHSNVVAADEGEGYHEENYHFPFQLTRAQVHP